MRAALALLFGLTAALAPPVGAAPAVQEPSPFEQALQESTAQDKPLVVFVPDVPREHSWKGDDLWGHPLVRDWIREHAVAIQLRHPEDQPLMREWHVLGRRAIVVFLDGERFDQWTGRERPDQTVSRLEGVRAGRRALDDLREKAAGSGREAFDAKQDLVLRLLLAGQHQEALEVLELMLLTEERERFPFYGNKFFHEIRMSGGGREALDLLERFRGEYGEFLAEGSFGEVHCQDWLGLHEVLGRQEELIAWIREARTQSHMWEAIHRCEGVIFSYFTVWPMRAEKRFDVAGEFLRSPREFALSEAAGCGYDPDLAQDEFGNPVEPIGGALEDRLRIPASSLGCMRSRVGTVYRACLEAGRLAEAAEVAALALRFDDTDATRQALVLQALDAGVLTARHEEWARSNPYLLAEVREARAAAAESGPTDE